MGNKKAKDALRRRIDQLMEETKDPHRVVAILETKEGCEVETAEYGWSEVRQGETSVVYPFSL